ncbi:uncharacterized protein [Drosophila tropicalis]|uniref:uncharacterized protein n=1 Tax=Drosophila tropicalis TaxID=46794 RepID=UPI0035ABF9E3
MAEVNTNNDQYNADELEAPEWLNADFIRKVLSQYENEPKLKVLDVKNSPATKKADHYASVMFRTSVDYHTEKGQFFKSLIVKAMPEQEGHKKDMLSESHIFETEIGMYAKVLPEFEKILQQAGDHTKLNANCIYYSLEPRKVLIFEDLLPLGYNLIRNRNATHEEVSCVYAKLATWHAASLKLQNEQPEFLKEFKYGLFEMPNFKNDPFVTTGMAAFLKLLDEKPEFANYRPFFEKMKNNYIQHLEAIMTEYRTNRHPDGYYVLSHGDFHLGNMMYKYNKETGAVDDCMLVDFQICNLSPITIDLIYSLYTLMGPEDRLYNWDKLYEFYFKSLLANLKKIGYKGTYPTLDGFWKQIYRHKYFDFQLVTTFLPLAWAVRTKGFGVIDLIEKEDVRHKTYRIDGYLNDLKVLLPRYEKLGYFDDLQ